MKPVGWWLKISSCCIRFLRSFECLVQVLEMERLVLNHLKFELTTPTTKSFLRRFIRAAQTGYKVPTLNLEFLGNFLAELTLVVYGFLQYLPSLIAASAVFLAKLTLDPTVHPWDSTLQHYTGYKASELKECVMALHELQCNTKKCTLPAIREKYCQHKFKCVSKLMPPTVLPPEYFCDIKFDSFPDRTDS
jgi:cyclin A